MTPLLLPPHLSGLRQLRPQPGLRCLVLLQRRLQRLQAAGLGAPLLKRVPQLRGLALRGCQLVGQGAGAVVVHLQAAGGGVGWGGRRG